MAPTPEPGSATTDTPPPAGGASESWARPVIVCGLRGVGLRIVEQLRSAGVPVVVLDRDLDPHRAADLSAAGVTVLARDPGDPKALVAAGLHAASAIVCTLEDDLQTLQTALLARQGYPDVRVVVQMRNPAVGRALIAAGVSVLDVARLSTPSLVEACLGTGVIELEVGGQSLVVVEAVATRTGTLRSQFSDWAPVAVHTPEGELLICPGRDERVPAGSVATLIGRAQDLGGGELTFRGTGQRRALRQAGLIAGAPSVAGRVYTGRGYRAAAGHRTPARAMSTIVRSTIRAFDGRLVVVVSALLALVVGSTVLLHGWYVDAPGHHLGLLDSLYLTIVTIGTVGYGDFGFRGQSAALRWFAIGEIVIGATLLTTTFALITNLLISRRIAESLGRGRVDRLVDHVVVVGLGSVGLGVVRELRAEGREVVVVDDDPANHYLPQVRALGVPVLIGDATLPETLIAAHVSAARAVVVLTSHDLTNVETALAVRSARPSEESGEGFPIVLRLFDRELARTVQATFDFHQVRSTAELAAPWFVGAAVGVDVLASFYAADLPMLLGHLRVGDTGGLVNLAMRELSARTRVIAIRRRSGAFVDSPRRDTRFEAGDEVYVVGPYEELLAVLRRDGSAGAAVQTAVSP